MVVMAMKGDGLGDWCGERSVRNPEAGQRRGRSVPHLRHRKWVCLKNGPLPRHIYLAGR